MLSDVMVVLSRLSVRISGLAVVLSRIDDLLLEVAKVLGSSSAGENGGTVKVVEGVWIDVGSEIVTSIVVTLGGKVTTGLR